jgi:hypothetical protein
MNAKARNCLSALVATVVCSVLPVQAASSPALAPAASPGFVNAAQFGFSPTNSGLENTKALQRAVDRTGTIIVSEPGTYNIGGTVFIGSHTALVFGHNVFLKKVNEAGEFTHVLLNKGALTKTWDEHISVAGLSIIVNGMDVRNFLVYSLHGQLAFFYVKDLRVERFRCLDLGRSQYGIHVCTFEDIVIEDVMIRGDKDGVHLGRGKRFTIRDGTFQTYDDAIALNAHDYDVGNPELGWIEEGLVENCRDLTDDKKKVGFFCRIIAGAWLDWSEGMEVQKSDTVVSQGRLYRVFAAPDKRKYKSVTRPTHERGRQELDGITWVMVQDYPTYDAGVRNVTFRDIFLERPRTGFSVHVDNDHFSRSVYPGAKLPQQAQLSFDNIRVLHNEETILINVRTPVDVLAVANSSLRHNRIVFHGLPIVPDYLPTKINLTGCSFNHPGALDLVENLVPGKQITLKTTGSVELSEKFSARVIPGKGTITVDSDLTGLKK